MRLALRAGLYIAFNLIVLSFLIVACLHLALGAFLALVARLIIERSDNLMLLIC